MPRRADSVSDQGRLECLSTGPVLFKAYKQKKQRYFPNFDGTKDSGLYGNKGFDSDEDNESEMVVDCSGGGYHWQNDKYWKLPENVRHAIDVAEMKQKHTEFWRRLQTMNDKIYVFRSVFYSKMPSYQRAFYEKKQKALEERLAKEKEQAEQEMSALNLKIKKSKLKSENSKTKAKEA